MVKLVNKLLVIENEIKNGCFFTTNSARDKFCIDPWLDVYLVLEEDGTEVDDEEYFQVSGIHCYANMEIEIAKSRLCFSYLNSKKQRFRR